MNTTTIRRAGQRAFTLIHLLVLISILSGLVLSLQERQQDRQSPQQRRPALRHQVR